MFWLTLCVVLLVAAAVSAVLVRHPGVMLYDWFATRRAAARASRVAAAVPSPSQKAAPAHKARGTPVEHAEPAAIAG